MNINSNTIAAAVVAGTILISATSVFAEEVRGPRQDVQQQIQAKRQELQTKIDAIRDTAKRRTANAIVGQFTRMNKVWTDHFTRVLNHLTAVLEKIKTRTDRAAANGKDVAAVNTAIQKATDAIAAAKTAVAAQAAKTYAIDTPAVTSTATDADQQNLVARLREQFKTVHAQLKADLAALRDGPMKAARQAVQDAFQALRQVPNVDN